MNNTDANEQDVEHMQDHETGGSTCEESGESGGNRVAKAEAEDEGKTRVVRRVPDTYNRDIKVQEVLKVPKPKAKARGRPNAELAPRDEDMPGETLIRGEK